MAKLNIYRLDKKKIDEFNNHVSKKLNFISTKHIIDSKKREFEISFYLQHLFNRKELPWNWVLREFDEDEILVVSNPKALIQIKVEDNIYAITFGTAYFFVDKFCDRKFPFEFAKRSDYKDIKTTALISPSRQKNKTINTYINCNELEYDSGESFSKIKANMKIDKDEERFNGTIEIGNSIRFSMKENSLENIVKIIDYIEETLSKEIIHKIPLFNMINDERVEVLDNKLTNYILTNEVDINFSELDIIGVSETFLNNDYEYKLKLGRNVQSIETLNYNIIMEFMNGHHIGKEQILNLKIILYQDGIYVGEKHLKELIDFISDEDEVMLSGGVWYEYNEDYLRYLTDSLDEIPVVYNSEYDFSDKIYNDFIKEKSKSEGIDENILLKKYYKEFAYNTILEEKYNFENHDREIEMGHECMDLYKDGTMYAVKIGKSSSKLCYVVDQSVTSLKLYKSNKLDNFPTINTVAIWIVLDRKTKLDLKNGKPDINQLNMLMLKIRINEWKKIVRSMGYQPVIYLNYYSNN